MAIRRVVPNIQAAPTEASRAFYADFLGFEVGFDLGWILTFVSPTEPAAQLSVIEADAAAPVHPDLTIEVDQIESLYRDAQRRGHRIIYPLTDEAWGVRRFFVQDPHGRIVNVMTHP